MFKQLVSRRASRKAAAPATETGLARIRSSYDEWRITQDIGAVMAVLDRLSDRRLAMIGMHRDGLYDAVAELMERADERRQMGDDVLAILAGADAKHTLSELRDDAEEADGAEEAAEAASGKESVAA